MLLTRFYCGIFLQIICQALLNVSLLRSRFEVYLSSTFKRVFDQSLFSSINVFVTSVDFKESPGFHKMNYCSAMIVSGGPLFQTEI